MTKLPISFVFMTSTKGHYGHDTYLDTLNHYDRQLPLSQYATKVAHIKISLADGAKGAKMVSELEARGFKVLTSMADWQRGQSHQNQYLLDQIYVSKESLIYQNPHILYVEDDAPIGVHEGSLVERLGRMTSLVDSSPDILTARFIRRGDFDGGVPQFGANKEYFFSPYTDFQPLIMRSSHFYLMLKQAEDNLANVRNIQIEALWRMILEPFSRAKHKHVVWMPDMAEAYHLGVPDYLKVKASLNL